MKQPLFLLLLLGISLGACRSLRVRDFHTKESLPTRLPHLDLLVHERSFLGAFDGALERETMFSTVGPDPWVAYGVTDQALADVFHVLDNELEDNLTQGASPQYGHARFKLLFYQRRNSGWGWTTASIATLLIPNVFGMPAATSRVELELQMEIVDTDGKLLGRYTAPGVGKGQVAAYHGYDNTNATRKANLVALQNALLTIKKKLEPEVATLSKQLEIAGTARKLDGK